MSFVDPKWIPPATASVRGGIKVGDGLSAEADGTLKALSSDLPASGLSGFPNRTDSTITISDGNVVVSPVASSFSFWTGGTKHTKTAPDSAPITADNILSYVKYPSTGTLSVSTTPFDPAGIDAMTALVYRTGSQYKRYEERHGHTRDRARHAADHATIGTRWASGLGAVFGNTTFSIDSGVIYDEDNKLTIASTTACSLFYRAAGAAHMSFEDNITTPYKAVAGTLQYDDAGTLTDVSLGYYTPVFVYATNAHPDDYPIHIVIGQSQHSAVTGARNAPAPTIPAMPTREWKLLYRAIYRQTAGGIVYTEAFDYRETGLGPGSSYTPSIHNNTVLRDEPDAHPAEAISYGITTVGDFLDSISSFDWKNITGVTRTDNVTLSKTGIGTLLDKGRLVRYAWGTEFPSDPSAFTYGLVGTLATDSVTLFLGEYIPEGTGTLYVQYSEKNVNLYTKDTPVLGPWAAAVVNDAFETYAAWHCRTEKPRSRFIGAYNLYPLGVDSGATQPSINFVVGSTTFLGTPYTVAAEPSDPMLSASTGMVTAGIDAEINTRVKLAVTATGTNKNAIDLQMTAVYAVLT